MRSIESVRNATRRIVFAGVLCASALAAHADGGTMKPVLSGYTDGVAGASLMAGDYQRVIERLGTRGLEYSSDELSASTNLCVAYVVTRHWTAAHAACDEAIRIASTAPRDGLLFTYKIHDYGVALAYSNRAVLNWLEARQERAASDIARAQTLSPDAQFVAQNVAALTRVNAAPVAAVVSAR